MKVDLKKYMTERDKLRDKQQIPGPVITISREYGCDANPLARQLIRRINDILEKKTIAKRWKLISKEIIDESAKSLRLSPNRLEERVLQDALSGIEAIFSGLSHHYSYFDREIVDTIKDLIESYANNGHVIIIGRGGASLTQSIKSSIHVRLMAPREWKIQKLVKQEDVSEKKANILIEKMDHDRKLWSEHLSDEAFDISLFDLVFNRKKLSDEEIIDSIIRLMHDRQMI